MSDTFKDKLHLALIQSIYETVLSPGEWEDVLCGIVKSTGAQIAFFIGLNGSAEKVDMLPKGIQKSALVDPGTIEVLSSITAGMGHGGLHTMSIRHTGLPWVERLCGKFGEEGQLIVLLVSKDGPRRFALFLFFANATNSEFAKANDVLMVLLPHLQIASLINKQMSLEREKGERMERIFLRSPTPRVILTPDFKIHLTTKSFDKLAADSDSPLTSGDGLLEIRHSELSQQVEGLISRVTRGYDDHGVAWVASSGSSGGWLVSVDALSSRSCQLQQFRNLSISHEATVLLSIREVGKYSAMSADTIRAVLGLSPTEASLAYALMNGDSPAEMAQQRCVSKNTIHNQLTSALARLGLHRQLHLVNLLAVLSFFIPV